MEWIQAAILGIVQGLTEFFPVSSSGHLVLVPKLFHWPDQGLAFDTVLHLGTLFALLWFFRHFLFRLVRQALSKRINVSQPARRLIGQAVLGSIPSLILGFFLHAWVEEFARSAVFIAMNLFLWAGILLVADRSVENRGTRLIPLEDVNWKKAGMIALAQPLALLPGTSRSGITISVGMLAGLSRETAARFSFLLSIPVTAAAGGYGLVRLVLSGNMGENGWVLFVGFVTAFLSGAWAIRFLLSYVAKRRYDLFVFYRLALAALVLFIFLR